MKRLILFPLLFCILLSGCAASPASSGSAPATSSPSASSYSSPADTPAAPSSSASSGKAEVSTESAARVETRQEFVSVQAQDSTQKILLVFQIPTDWVYNGYNVFEDESGKKVLEIGSPFLASESAAFSDTRVTQFDGTDSNTEGVYLGKQEFSLSEQEGLSRKAVAYCYETYPADSNTAWYPCHTFTYTQGYVLPLHFYQSEKQDDLALIKQVLNDLEIFISKTAVSSSSAVDSGNASSGSEAVESAGTSNSTSG